MLGNEKDTSTSTYTVAIGVPPSTYLGGTIGFIIRLNTFRCVQYTSQICRMTYNTRSKFTIDYSVTGDIFQYYFQCHYE